LAVTQLKGVKLLAWALCLAVLAHAWELVLHGEPAARAKTIGETGQQLFQTAGGLGLPTLEATFDAVAAKRSVSSLMAWAALVAQFISTLLSLAIWGHVIIATCRMAGFRALRNTRNPLASKTLAEFWNRYYYYFKELLVDFFFYPTFLRCFRKRPRLRKAFATVAAAGFGNVLYHYLRDSSALSTLGPWEALVAFRSYVVYGLILGLAIAASQDRASQRATAPSGRLGFRRVTGPIVVCGFFCVMSLFGQSSRGHSLETQMDYFATLLGLA
jgi:D-alanyl-lipoteichoic acid acyltransferase DltB (MBOAT superfamily)